MMIKKFFLKRFKVFFLIMMIPTFIFFLISIGYINFNVQNNIKSEINNTLSNTRNNFDLITSNSAYQYELLTYNPRLVLSLQKLLLQENFEYTDVVFLNSIKTILGTVATSQLHVDSIYLYIDGFDNFFSSTNGVCTLNDHFDTTWYESYASSPPANQWIEKRSYKESSFSNEKQVISIFQKMSNMKGLIVININPDQFKRALNTSLSKNKEQLFILNQSGDILISNTTDSLPTNQPVLDFIHDRFGTDLEALSTLNNKWVAINHKYYLLNSRLSPDYDIAFLSLVPLNAVYQNSKSTLLIFFIVLLLNCLVVLLLSYMTTRRNFKQIDIIIDIFDNAEKGIVNTENKKLAKDEYGVILNNVINLHLKTTYLNQQLVEKKYKHKIAELASLQLQINPHFLFNTLQTLDFEALMLTEKPTQLNKIIHDLSDILKYALESPLSYVSLRNELNYLKKYADIQQYRYGGKFIIYYEIEDHLLDCTVFRLMLQPLIENSMFHGIRPLERTGYIKLKVFLRHNHIYFYVVDSGIGMTKDEISALYTRITDDNSDNIGITNLNRRLVLQYGPTSSLHIRSKKGFGSCISFRIPYTLD